MSDIEKIHGITPDLTKENVDRLLALFPDVATEITDPGRPAESNVRWTSTR